jgi:type IV secretory pathway TraG/TraD family ATPase VirD4
MDKKWQIILIEASSPIKCQKIFYFKDKFFTSRLMKQIVLPVQDFTNKSANKDTLNEAVPKVKMLEQHPDSKPTPKPEKDSSASEDANAA